MQSPYKYIVSASKLSKTYGTLEAVKQVDLAIETGEIFGLIGPDGAGKTTIFHMLGGILDPTSGELSVIGMDANKARLQIGYLTQQFSLYSDLSVDENLRYASGLRNVPIKEFLQRKDHYLKLMELDRFSDRLAGNLSGGMKQKLALCCALISRPKLLLLDEPTTGVDPVSRREFWNILATVAHEGVTVAVATPYLDEAERCTRVALIHKGEIQQLGTPLQLKEKLQLHRLELRGQSIEQLTDLIMHTSELQGKIEDVQEFGDRLDLLVQNPELTSNILVKSANEKGFDINISKQEPMLENVFTLAIKHSEPELPKTEFLFTATQHHEGMAIQATDLSKSFDGFRAVKNVNINVNYGEIYGLLGANGAGKTTTIKMLCGLIEASSGKMILAGESSDLRSPLLRQKMGYMSQKFTLYEDLTVMENLRFYGGIYEVPQRLMNERIQWVIKTCNLSGREDMLTRKLPGGFRQRLAFGATVLHQPEILFLDEPTSGVDPLARRQLWELIGEFAKQGTAVLITTHFLEEAEHCHQLGFMVTGELVAVGSPFDIKASQSGQLIEILTSNNQQAVELLQKEMPRWRASIFGSFLHIVIDNDQQRQSFEKELIDAGIKIISSRAIPFSLEDAFIGIVERNKRAQVAA